MSLMHQVLGLGARYDAPLDRFVGFPKCHVCGLKHEVSLRGAEIAAARTSQREVAELIVRKIQEAHDAWGAPK